jgi:hypothetical protein
MDAKKKPIQTGGSLQMWRSPDNSYRHHFLELDLSCEPGNYAGILIFSDATHSNVEVFNIESLWKELPNLLEKRKDEVIAYWWREDDAKERSRMLSDLTTRPVFLG